jgi:DHA1 family bicyclomycin/chloramphenicol resistance-like MFS transporter
VFSLSACGVIGASQLNRLWLRKRSSKEISMASTVAQSAVGMLLVVGAVVGIGSTMIVVMLVCYLVGIGFISPNTTALAIEPFTSHAGTASALLGSMQMTAGAIGSALVSYFHNGTALPMAVLLMASSVAGLGLQFGYRVRQKRNSQG